MFPWSGFLFLQGQGVRLEKKKTKNTCFPPCIIPDLGGTPVLLEDGFVVESRGLGYT